MSLNDIFLGNVTYFNRIDERSAFAVSLKYFSLGDIEFVTDEFSEALIQRPNELTVDASYALRLSDQFGMSVAMRYLRSDLRLDGVDGDATPASTFGVDISGYYQSEEIPYDSFDGRWRAGFNFSNIGPKLKYDETGQENNIPTNMALGGGFDFILDQYNKVSALVEVNKLLVPTPSDSNEDGTINSQDDYYNESFVSGVFSSFGDAPDGFGEELKEFTWALGAEYTYQDSFAFRVGYFNESDEKGSRKFATLGAGFKYTSINIIRQENCKYW